MARSRFNKLVGYFRPHWKQATAGVVALLLVNVFGVAIPLLISEGIDDLTVTFSYRQVLQYGGLIRLLASAMWVMRMASRIWLFGMGRQVEFDLKQSIFEHLLTLEPAYFANNTAGELISRATSDVDNIRRLLGFAILSLANTLFAYTLTLPVMISINFRLTVVAVLVYPVMLVLVQIFGDRLRDELLEVQEQISDLSRLIQEDMSGIALIKIYAQEANERRAFGDRNQDLLKANLALARTRNILFPLLGGLASISLLTVLAMGAGAIINGAITVGEFVAMLLYVERLVFPTALLGFTITAYQRGEVSIARVEEILMAEPKISSPTAQPLGRVQGQVSARHLSYTFPGSTTPGLRDVSFTIEPGQIVAIVGPIGSGKSTLANALPRLLDIGPNQLFIDGQDVTTLSLQDLRGAIAFVPQDSFLFSTTIENNIRYGKPETALRQTVSAAHQAQIAGEIDTFPQQYDTIVGERGITLSGGQRQRTALARSLVVDAPILVLDDALASVDNQTATAILHSLTAGTQRKTVIFISHQMSAAAAADRILVMNRGKIVQSGDHESLVQQPGLYQRLWDQHKLEEVLG